MDEVAFVESLFNPDLRTTPQASPRLSLRSSLVVSTSTLPSPSLRPKMFHGDGHGGHTNNPIGGGLLRVGGVVGPDEEEVFRQLLNDHDFGESLALPGVSDQLHSAGLLEPLELPKGGVGVGHLDAGFKDAFLDLGESPAVTPSVTPRVRGPKLFSPQPMATATPTSTRVELPDPHRTPRNSLYSDHLMPVLPLSVSTTTTAPSAPANPNGISGSSSSVSAIQALQQAIWSNSPSGGLQRLNPNSIKHVMMAVNSSTASASSSSRHATHPIPPPPPLVATSAAATSVTPAVLGLSPTLPASPLWLSSALLTPTAPFQSVPELSRTITGKKPVRTQRTAKSTSTRQSATALSVSLVHAPPAKARRPNPATSVTIVAHPATPAKVTKGKKCVEPGCVRRAQSNSRCKAHGGGARCQYTGPGGCTRSSQGGGFCRAHGGGKRCEFPGCTRGQQRKGRCYVHGGIRKCQMDGCEKKDRGNGFCISHGGGKRCVHAGCSRAVRRGQLCQLHEEGANGPVAR